MNATSTSIFGRMTGWQAVELKGPDAQDYLQRLTSADFRRLSPGDFTPGTLLSPTGKITLYFKALVLDSGHYLLLVPPTAEGAGAAAQAFEALEKMHFRENFTITPQPDEWAYLRVLSTDEARLKTLGEALPAPGKLRALNDGRLVLNENRWAREPLKFDLGMVVPAARLAPVIQGLRQVGYNEAPSLEPFRLRAFEPAAPAELNATTIPLEARLDDAVHENKGCYPGQEVVERIRSMGQAPRTLVQLSGTGAAPAPAAAIVSDGQPVGTVTSSAADALGGGWVALGYLKRVFAKPEASYTIGEQTVNVRFH